jgi:photosystem II stability/assembly factor-like uncharacterized protein
MRIGLAGVLLIAGCGSRPVSSVPRTESTGPQTIVIADAAPPVAADEEVTPAAPPPTNDVASRLDEFTITPGPARSFGGASGNVPGDSGITGLWASGDRVIAVGNGFAFRSGDRGQHFARVDVAVRFPVVWGPTKDSIYVGGESGSFHSTDGGATFTRCAVTPGVVQAIWGKGTHEVYIVGGPSPFVAKSTDDCASWTPIPTPVSDGWLYDITTTEQNDLLVSGEDRTAAGDRSHVILRSTNGGKSWSRLRAIKERGPGRRLCFASGVLFATSVYDLYATRDLGKTWKLATKVGAEVLSLACRGKEVIVGGARTQARRLARSRPDVDRGSPRIALHAQVARVGTGCLHRGVG